MRTCWFREKFDELDEKFSDNPETRYKTESLKTYQLWHKGILAEAGIRRRFPSSSVQISADLYALQPKRTLSEASSESGNLILYVLWMLSEHGELP